MEGKTFRGMLWSYVSAQCVYASVSQIHVATQLLSSSAAQLCSGSEVVESVMLASCCVS